MAFMASYKPGQGKQARTAAALLLLFVLVWGCYSFVEYGNSKLDRLFQLQNPFFSKPISWFATDSGITDWLTWSFVLAIVLFVVLFLRLRSWINKPTVADHLIGTELEMRRVKWPKKPEVLRSGGVVITYVFWLTLIIFLLDLIMSFAVGVVVGQSWDQVGVGRLINGIIELFGGGA